MKGRFSRAFLMIAGIFTVTIILLSQSLYQPSIARESISKQEKSKEGKPSENVSIAPSEVVPSPAVQLDKSIPSLLKIFAEEENTEKSFFPGTSVFVSFFKTLLRATISPNAP